MVVRPFPVHFGIARFEVGRALLPVKPATGRSAHPTIVKAQTEHDRARYVCHCLELEPAFHPFSATTTPSSAVVRSQHCTACGFG